MARFFGIISTYGKSGGRKSLRGGFYYYYITGSGNCKFEFSYRNNVYFLTHHGRISKHHLAVVYTKFEVKRTIIKVSVPVQTENRVFEILTTGHRKHSGERCGSTGPPNKHSCNWVHIMPHYRAKGAFSTGVDVVAERSVRSRCL